MLLLLIVFDFFLNWIFFSKKIWKIKWMFQLVENSNLYVCLNSFFILMILNESNNLCFNLLLRFVRMFLTFNHILSSKLWTTIFVRLFFHRIYVCWIDSRIWRKTLSIRWNFFAWFSVADALNLKFDFSS